LCAKIQIDVRRKGELCSRKAGNGFSSRDLIKLLFPVPPVPEQLGIADVLSDMDAEIAALEARLDKTKLLKQGMMQELLTGRIRLI
jgi:type I restriction enzyme S subunit